MITTILEVLVAVVVLIVIIAVAALRFLRADDSDAFDDMPEEPRKTRRHPADIHPANERGPAQRRPRRPEPPREQRAAGDRGARQPGYGNPGAPERRNGPGTGPQRPVPVGARQASAARAADADPATGWDSLSDVDYWAEVASDKPLPAADAPTTVALSPAKRTRRGIEPKADAPRPADLPAARADSGQLPLRQRSQSRRTRYGAEPATESLAALARLGDQPPPQQRPGSRPAPVQRGGSPQPAAAAPPSPTGQRPIARQSNGQRSPQRPAPGPRPGGASRGSGPRALPPALPQSPAAQASQSGGQARPPRPMDDDPLTSPSFPAINTSDSRSYRTQSRSSSQTSSSGGRGNGSYSEPARQLPDYPGQTSAPNGYPVQPAAAAAGHVPAHSAAPAANPYGSYVSSPQPGYPQPASAHLDAAAYGTGYAAGQQAVAAANWYAGSTGGNQAIDGYLPAPGNGNGAGNGYSQSDYGISYQPPAYPGGQPALPAGGGYAQPGHPGQYDQRGYHGPDAGYGQDGYEPYPGYGAAR